MEFVARKTDLLRELALLQGCAEAKSAIPILSHIWLHADAGGQLRFAATDLHVSLRTGCAATVTEPGTLALPAKSFFDIVRSFPDTDVRVVTNTTGATVTADQYDGHMHCGSADDFPTLPEPVTTAQVTLERATVRELLSKVQFATTGDDNRYFLNGALLLLTPKTVTLVATDGHRLALAEAPRQKIHGTGQPKETRMLLAHKTMTELVRLLADQSATTFTITAGSEHQFVQVGDRTLTARQVDGTFPTYERVIPTHPTHTFTLNREALATAVRRVAILADGKTMPVQLTFTANACAVRAASSTRGEALEPIVAGGTETLEPNCDLTIRFNGSYLLEGLAACATDAVTLACTTGESAAVIRPVNGLVEYTYVLMPVRM